MFLLINIWSSTLPEAEITNTVHNNKNSRLFQKQAKGLFKTATFLEIFCLMGGGGDEG